MVQAIFLKGSMARNEHDEYSDIDLYCLVDEKDVEAFKDRRYHHLSKYGNLLFYDEIFIVAPQVIAVYEDLLHVDLFAVTLQTLIEKDDINVLFDPTEKLSTYQKNHNLELSSADFQDAVDDVVWFLFQYDKSSSRGNDIWSINMINNVMVHLSKVLLHHYSENRAQLGLKTIEKSLPKDIINLIHQVYENNTPQKHKLAVVKIMEIISKEKDWILSEVSNPQKISPLWSRVEDLF